MGLERAGLNNLSKWRAELEPDYLMPSADVFETVGLSALFLKKLELIDDDAGTDLHSLASEVLESKFNHIELQCKGCRRLYSIDGSYCTDELYSSRAFECRIEGCDSTNLNVFFEKRWSGNIEVSGPPRVVCYENPTHKHDTITQFNVRCEKLACQTKLDWFLIGNERTESTLLYALYFADKKISRGVGFFAGAMNMTETSTRNVLNWLFKEGYLKHRGERKEALEILEDPFKVGHEMVSQSEYYLLNNKGHGFRNKLLGLLGQEIGKEFETYASERLKTCISYSTQYTVKNGKAPRVQHISDRLLSSKKFPQELWAMTEPLYLKDYNYGNWGVK